MKSLTKGITLFVIVISLNIFGNNNTFNAASTEINNEEFLVEYPQHSYPLPVVDNIFQNCDTIKNKSINENPVVYLLRGINDIWRGTSDSYQSASSKYGPGKDDRLKGNPIVDSVIWRENIQYCIKVTNNRSDDEAILAFLDDVRSKFYSVTDGFGPLTETYIKNSGVYVDLPLVETRHVLHDPHYQSSYNNSATYAGDENSPLGAVVKFVREVSFNCSSTQAPKYLYSTPRPWRMNERGEVIFLGTTYDTLKHKPTYSCIDHTGNENFKIYDLYESSVKVVPGLICSRKEHKVIYDDFHPDSNDLYTNTTTNIRTDNGYPSGHTNAGALISMTYAYAFPERFSELVFRGSQLGEDRIIAGMHSPVDVIGGKLMALSVVCSALNQQEIAEDAEDAIESIYEIFNTKADSANMSLYDFAHLEVENPIGYTNGDYVNVEVFNNNIYDDKEKIKKLYRERLTYGFSQDKSQAGKDPIVPKGAEAILKSRFPYLTANQRRCVLYTTEIPSGYKILDKTNGWGRIDLLRAADGYGSFIGETVVTMDASLGRFNAVDTWGNNIDGTGSLKKAGSGKLILTGNNTFSGGTSITDGTIVTTSNTSLGSGDVTINKNGKLEIYNPLKISGSLNQNGGNIFAYITQESSPVITVDQEVNLQNSSLIIEFDKSLNPQKGDRFTIIKAPKLEGKFNTIIADGISCKLKHIDNTIYIVVK